MKKFVSAMFVAASLATASQTASAACSATATMGGTWQFLMGENVSGSLSCLFTLAGNGNITAASCTNVDSNSTDVVSVSSGNFATTAACTLSGRINFSNGVSYIVDSGRLDLSRNTGHIIGHSTFDVFSSATLVRY
jgi:hypothetical protein